MHVENIVAHAKEEMGTQRTGRNKMPLSTFLLGHEGQTFLRNGRQKGEGFCSNCPGFLPTDRGQASAGARADDPLWLPSLKLCSDSEVELLLAGSCWASFSTVRHGQLLLRTRSCSS
jgi:hypothetical protein